MFLAHNLPDYQQNVVLSRHPLSGWQLEDPPEMICLRDVQQRREGRQLILDASLPHSFHICGAKGIQTLPAASRMPLYKFRVAKEEVKPRRRQRQEEANDGIN
jgi:hypothetical protein